MEGALLFSLVILKIKRRCAFPLQVRVAVEWVLSAGLPFHGRLQKSDRVTLQRQQNASFHRNWHGFSATLCVPPSKQPLGGWGTPRRALRLQSLSNDLPVDGCKRAAKRS